MNDPAENRKENGLSTNNNESIGENPFLIRRTAPITAYSTEEINQHSNNVTNYGNSDSATVTQLLDGINRPFYNRQNSTSPPPGQSGRSNYQKAKERKKNRESENNVRKAEDVNGFRGNESLDSLVQYIEGNKADLSKQKNIGKETDTKTNKKNKPKNAKRAAKKLSNPESENENAFGQDGEVDSANLQPERSPQSLDDSDEEDQVDQPVPVNHESSQVVALSSPKSDDVDSLSSNSLDDTAVVSNVKPTEENCTVEKFIRSVASQNNVALCCATIDVINKENAMTLVTLEKRLMPGEVVNEKCLVNKTAVDNNASISSIKAFGGGDSKTDSDILNLNNDISYRHHSTAIAKEQKLPAPVGVVQPLPPYECSSSTPNDAHSPSASAGQQQLLWPPPCCRCRRGKIPVEFLDKNFEIAKDRDIEYAKDNSGGAFSISFGVDDFFVSPEAGAVVSVVDNYGSNQSEAVAAVEKRVESAHPDRIVKKIINKNDNASNRMSFSFRKASTPPLDRRSEKLCNDIVDFAIKRWAAFMHLPGENTWYKK